MTERYDLVVVGAGPGGSATAYYASKAGLNTVLLDRQEFPRDKACGDGLMPHAASEISLMGLGKWLDNPITASSPGSPSIPRLRTCARESLLP